MELYEILKQTGRPVAYHSFKEDTELPFLIWIGAGSKNFGADDKVYHNKYGYVVEYYYEFKDLEMEDKIEELFNSNEIYWQKSEDIYIESERMFVIYYYI